MEKGIEPKIIYEDENLLVLDKPCGLTVNRSDTTKGQITLQDWIVPTLRQNVGGRDPDQSVGKKIRIDTESDFYKRSGIVHRLDKETSGLILIAKNPVTFQNLQQQFKDRKIKKTYLAVVWGELKADGEINVPISRNPFNRKRFGVFIGGREAQTAYYVLASGMLNGQKITLLEVNPKTGRTHQIRVHLNYLGYPIVGDKLYSGRKLSKIGLNLIGRLMLHAYKISFIDPKTKISKVFKAKIPQEFMYLFPVMTNIKTPVD